MGEYSRTLERFNHRLSPASINSYYRCPRKFQMRYIRNIRPPWTFKSALVIGGIAHKAMADYFKHRRDGIPFNSLESYADRHLQRERYPEEESAALRAEHFPIILGHIERGIDALPEDAEILHIEKSFNIALRTPALSENVSIASRIDLVISHGDGIHDHIDFKTGQQGGDLIQNFVSRLTVVSGLNLPGDKIRTINILTRTGTYQIVPSDPELHRSTREIVRNTIDGLATDISWSPRPDPFVCRWCDFKTFCDVADLEYD